MTVSVCSSFIDVRTALFFGINKTHTDINDKANSSNLHRKTVKKPKRQR